jgi:hypothetical protein
MVLEYVESYNFKNSVKERFGWFCDDPSGKTIRLIFSCVTLKNLDLLDNSDQIPPRVQLWVTKNDFNNGGKGRIQMYASVVEKLQLIVCYGCAEPIGDIVLANRIIRCHQDMDWVEQRIKLKMSSFVNFYRSCHDTQNLAQK